MRYGLFELLNILAYTVFPSVVLAIVVVLGVRWAIARGLRDVARDGTVYTRIKGSPRDILDRRYADGEIGREDYLRMKSDIEDIVDETGNTVDRDA